MKPFKGRYFERKRRCLSFGRQNGCLIFHKHNYFHPLMGETRTFSQICFRFVSACKTLYQPSCPSRREQITSKNSFRTFSQNAMLKARHSASVKKSGLVFPLFLSAEKHLGRTAIIDCSGQFSYDDILHLSTKLSKDLLELCGFDSGTLDHARIGFLCENDVSYVITKFAIWMANGVGVPLCKSHPVSDLEYFIQDAGCSALVVSRCFVDKLHPLSQQLSIPLRVVDDSELSCDYQINQWFVPEAATSAKRSGKAKKTRPKRWYDLHQFNNGFKNDPALIIYTSGTTGRPKGVVLTHGNLWAMMWNMVAAWSWSPGDVVLHVLPLHHVHGVVNALMTPLLVGATCLMLPKFDPQKVWGCLVNPITHTEGVRVNMFMAVPTIYAKLLEHFEQHLKRGRGSRLASEYIKSVCMTRIRLMVSGSAALPQPIMEKWESVTGHRLLERYGMTETGMALTNPLAGPRVPGCVGKPFPSVEVCIAKPNVYSKNGYDVIAVGNSQRTTVMKGEEGESGELLVKGPSVFHQYWNRTQATKDAFTPDGWFKTGDTASVNSDGIYKIVGRTSVDVIKSGGYKISALEVERHLLAHPDISDCAVVGLPDITWGQRVAAVLVLKGKGQRQLSLEALKAWARPFLPPYQIPTVLRCVPALPRNAMGKVNKKELVTQVFPEYLNQR